jgi:hypothetical protein
MIDAESIIARAHTVTETDNAPLLGSAIAVLTPEQFQDVMFFARQCYFRGRLDATQAQRKPRTLEGALA